jgi:signal transduction histidine kinase
VNSLLQDSTGVLWVGTDDGLAFFSDGRFQLPANMPASLHEQILGIEEDRIGSLWIATANHVMRVTRENLVRGSITDRDVNEYGPADGLKVSEGVKRYRSVTADSQGLIWFSLSRGLSVVDPSRLASRSSVPAIVHINTMAADGSSLDLGQPIQIPSARQRISFNFQGLSLVTPERVRFRYMLDGFDHGWSAPTTAGEAVYTNLGPGSYHFHVIASNSDGVWNSAEDVLGFEIAPALWQTSWFRIAVLLAVGFTALAFYRFRLHQLTRQLNVRFEERLAERTLIAQELHDTLLQGFLSASMQLDVFVDQLPPDSPARSRLGKVLELMRQVIEEGRNALRGLRSSNGSGSLDLEQAFSRIQQEVITAEEVAFRVIVEGSSSPMHPVVRDEVYRIGHEALVNAFRHARAKNIEVDVAYLANHLRILVRDDGCGIDPEVLQSGREGHWGLSGMRERAERIGARLKVWSRDGSGTEVELVVPSQVAFQNHSSTRPAGWFGKLSARVTAGVSGEAKNETKK